MCSGDLLLVEVGIGTLQLKETFESTDMDELGLALCIFSVPDVAHSKVIEFLHQRLCIGREPSLVWYQLEKQGNVRDTQLIEIP
jgi:hypothetical protein